MAEEKNDRHLHVMISQEMEDDINSICTTRGDKSVIIRAVLKNFITNAKKKPVEENKDATTSKEG